jgi:hypothetical protein
MSDSPAFAEARDRPDRVASRARNTILVETAADAPHRVTTGHEIIKDAAYHHRFGFIDLQMGWTSRTSGDAAKPMRHESKHDFTCARSEELAAAVAFGNLGAFILRNHPLHLNQQRGFRIVFERRGIEILHPDAMPG